MADKKLSDEEFLDVIRYVQNWNERDKQRTSKYQRIIIQARSKRRILFGISVVTGIAALAIITLLIPWNNTKRGIGPEELYEEFYAPYKFASDYRAGEPSLAGLFAQTVQAYKNTNWEVASVLADSLLLINPANSDNLLLKGLILQGSGKFEEAEKLYLEVIPAGGSYEQHARWYLALLYLKQRKIPESQSQLEILIKIKTVYYREKATLLIRSIQ